MADTLNTAAAATTAGLIPHTVSMAREAMMAVQDTLQITNLIMDASTLLDPGWERGLAVSGTVRVPIRPGGATFSSRAETGTAPDYQSYVGSYVDMSVGHFQAQIQYTALAASRDNVGIYNPASVMLSFIEGIQAKIKSQVGALADSFSAHVGTSGDPPYWELVRRAARNNIVRGKSTIGGMQFLFCAPEVWTALARDIGTDAVKAQRREFDLSQMLVPSGFQGIYDDVVVFTHDAMPLSSGDYTSLVCGKEALAWLPVPSPPQALGEIRVMDGGFFHVVAEYDGALQKHKLIAHTDFGVGILRNVCGTRIISTGDAAITS